MKVMLHAGDFHHPIVELMQLVLVGLAELAPGLHHLQVLLFPLELADGLHGRRILVKLMLSPSEVLILGRGG
jgi:hypothetical protein